jgi:F1F0 ATPase subunit 2
MNNTLSLLLALVAGLLLGVVFFGGLWWTVRRGLASQQAPLWFVASLLSRTAIAICGFYFVMQDDWRRLVACLFGFVLARICVIRLTRNESQKSSRLIQGGVA